jgi:ComF family protein
MKYYDQTDTIQLLARWMERTAAEFLAEDHLLIIPVPLHPFRLWRRKYNQAALLARALAKISGHPYLPRAMKRTKHRPPQASLARKARLQNMRGVFAVTEGYQQRIKGQTVLLVDDVMTTGATLNHCAATLKKAGAAKVFATTIAHSLLD